MQKELDAHLLVTRLGHVPRLPSDGPLREVLRDFGSLRSGSNKNNRLSPQEIPRLEGEMQCSGEVERWSSATHFLHDRGQEMVTRRLWHIRGAHHCMQPSHIHLTVPFLCSFCDSSDSFPPSSRQPILGASIQLRGTSMSSHLMISPIPGA